MRLAGSLVFVIAYFVVVGQVECAAVNKTGPIRIGLFTGLTYFDPSIVKAIWPVIDGTRVAVKAINKQGGIHGRPIEIVECETGMLPANFVTCLAMFDQQPDMLTVMSVFITYYFMMLQPKFIQYNLLQINPTVMSVRSYDRHWVYLQSEMRLYLSGMLQQALRLHRKRIGFLNTPDIGDSTGALADTIATLQQLGFEYTGTLGVNSTAFNKKWNNSQYFDFLAKRPQVIIAYIATSSATDEILLDIFNRTAFGNGIDPDLQFITWDGCLGSIQQAFNKIHTTSPGKIRASEHLCLVCSFPSLTDNRFAAVRHAVTDFTDYWGTTDYFKNRSDYAAYTVQYWASTNLAFEVMKRMDPANMTRLAFIDRMFDQGTFFVDDLRFGTFSNHCDNSSASFLSDEVLETCGCNQGFGEIHTYSLADNLSYVPIANGRKTTPLNRCSSVTAITPLVIFARAAASSQVESRIADTLFASAQQGGFNESETCSPALATDLPACISALNQSRFVSLVYPLVLPSTSIQFDRSLALIDPFYYPAQLAPPYTYNVIHIMATLQQEIFALAYYISGSSSSDGGRNATAFLPIHAVARTSSDDGGGRPALQSAISMSLGTFGASLASFTEVSPSASLSLAPGDGVRMVFGVTSTADVAAIASFLTANPQAVVCVTFSEFSVWYSSFASLVSSAASSRLIFATSLRNWFGPSAAANDQSSLMDSFFATKRLSRDPLSLRGFLVGAFIQQLSDLVAPSALTSANILSKLYSASIIGVGTNDILGAYSSQSCSTASSTTTGGNGAQQSVCSTNTGARKIRVMSLAIVTNASGLAESVDSEASYTFASANIPYSIASTSSSGLSQAVIAGIATGSAALCVVIITVMCYLGAGNRDNAYAPRDSSKPTTLIFTDIESSTALWAHEPEAMALAIDMHHRLIRQCIDRHQLYEVKTIGDAFMVAAVDPVSAFRFAVDCQRALLENKWPSAIDGAYALIEELEAQKDDDLQRSIDISTTGAPDSLTSLSKKSPEEASRWNGLRVRIGVHTGFAEIKRDKVTKGFDYYGTAANVAARVESVAQGGQVLVSKEHLAAVLEVDRNVPADLQVNPTSVGEHQLKGVDVPMELFNIDAVPGRVFTGRKRGEALHHQTSTAGMFFADQAARDGDDSSQASSLGAAMGKYRSPDWALVTSRILVILLSTSSRLQQSELLRSFCDKFHIVVESAPSSSAVPRSPHSGSGGSSGASSERPLEQDPYLSALSLRFAPILRKSFGQLVVNTGAVSTSRTTMIHHPTPGTARSDEPQI